MEAREENGTILSQVIAWLITKDLTSEPVSLGVCQYFAYIDLTFLFSVTESDHVTRLLDSSKCFGSIIEHWCKKWNF